MRSSYGGPRPLPCPTRRPGSTPSRAGPARASRDDLPPGSAPPPPRSNPRPLRRRGLRPRLPPSPASPPRLTARRAAGAGPCKTTIVNAPWSSRHRCEVVSRGVIFNFMCSARGRPGTRPVPPERWTGDGLVRTPSGVRSSPTAAKPGGSRVARCQGAAGPGRLGMLPSGMLTSLVEPRGFEPRTSAVQGRRSPG